MSLTDRRPRPRAESALALAEEKMKYGGSGTSAFLERVIKEFRKAGLVSRSGHCQLQRASNRTNNGNLPDGLTRLNIYDAYARRRRYRSRRYRRICHGLAPLATLGECHHRLQ